jgi:16S rRNA (guanine1516-N2)-methyltransferase
MKMILLKNSLDSSLAEQYSVKYGIPLMDELSSDTRFTLELTKGGLELNDLSSPKTKSLLIDFAAEKLQHRILTGGKNLPLAKAIGITAKQKPSVIDMTAGLGRDAFILASLGCTVTMFEESPVIAAMLEDALMRALEAPKIQSAAERLNLVFGNSAELVNQAVIAAKNIDVIYLDPMFPESKKSALTKKDMQYLQALLGHDNSPQTLLESALDSGVKRVVIKQPRHAENLTARPTTFEVKSKTHRFNVYVQ